MTGALGGLTVSSREMQIGDKVLGPLGKRFDTTVTQANAIGLVDTCNTKTQAR